MSHSLLGFSETLGAVAAGENHSLVVKEDGSVWTTGYNDDGQLGDKTTTNSSTFKRVIDGGAVAVAGGDEHSIVLMADGKVMTTGGNEKGQLGDGSNTQKTSFKAVTGTCVHVHSLFSVTPIHTHSHTHV